MMWRHLRRSGDGDLAARVRTLHRAISRLINWRLPRDALHHCRRWTEVLKVQVGRVLGHFMQEFCQAPQGCLGNAPIRKISLRWSIAKG